MTVSTILDYRNSNLIILSAPNRENGAVGVQGGTREQHQKAGKAGGSATAKKHGREFYSKIGIKGGQKRRSQAESIGDMDGDGKLDMYHEMGREGGKAVSKDRKHMAEIGAKGGRSKSNPKNYDDKTEN